MVKQPQRQEFEIVLEKIGTGAAIVVPFKVEEVFGSRAQVKVRGTIDGYPYRSSVAPMGGGTHYMVVNKTIRDAIGKNGGDAVRVVMEIDTEERTVTVPDDFQRALDENPKAKAIFDKFAFTHRREYVQWVEGAKKLETRTNRIKKAVERIADGIKFS